MTLYACCDSMTYLYMCYDSVCNDSRPIIYMTYLHVCYDSVSVLWLYDLSTCVLWLIYTWRYDSSICVLWLVYIWLYDLRIYVPWLSVLSGENRPPSMTPSSSALTEECHDAFLCVQCLIHMRVMAHLYVCDDLWQACHKYYWSLLQKRPIKETIFCKRDLYYSFTCVPWFINRPSWTTPGRGALA